MKYAIATALIVALVAGVAFSQIQQSGRDTQTDAELSNASASKAKLILVSDFAAENVIGHLGQPLGTIVRVTGVAIDGRTTRRKGDMGKTLLEIETVNGIKLKSKVRFDFHRAAKGISKPKAGTRFDYYVHEYGVFDGIVVPDESFGIEYTPVAHDGFYYRRKLTVHKSL